MQGERETSKVTSDTVTKTHLKNRQGFKGSHINKLLIFKKYIYNTD